MYSTLGPKLNLADSPQNLRSQRPRRMPTGMDHRAAYAVMVWRSLPHLPAGSAATAVVQAVNGRYDPADHVLTGHQLALLQLVVTHIVLAGVCANVVRFMHGAARSRQEEGCASCCGDGTDRPHAV